MWQELNIILKIKNVQILNLIITSNKMVMKR